MKGFFREQGEQKMYHHSDGFRGRQNTSPLQEKQGKQDDNA